MSKKTVILIFNCINFQNYHGSEMTEGTQWSEGQAFQGLWRLSLCLISVHRKCQMCLHLIFFFFFPLKDEFNPLLRSFSCISKFCLLSNLNSINATALYSTMALRLEITSPWGTVNWRFKWNVGCNKANITDASKDD